VVAQKARCRAHFAASQLSGRGDRDWLADEAVWREPLSASNSLIIREKTGKFVDFGPRGLDPQRKKTRFIAGFWRNSLRNVTGNSLSPNRGDCAGTGNFL
jgi:hypothetical protein